MAVDVLEGLLEEDDEVVQVSTDPAVIGPVQINKGGVTWKEKGPLCSGGCVCASVLVCKAVHNIKSVFFYMGASADETNL